MMARARGDSVFDEPNFRAGPFPADPSERAAAGNLTGQGSGAASAAERAALSVWDEPALAPELAGAPPPEADTYARWLAERILATGWTLSWCVTLAVAAVAGPWAILGAIFGPMLSGQGAAVGILATAVVVPVVEETMKAAAILYILEKWPYLFKSRAQIVLCAAAAGLVFAAVENVMYLHVYIPDAPAELARWRWTVCVALHTGCTLISGIGLAHVWHRTVTTLTAPQLPIAGPYFVLAAVIHGAYNGSVTLLALSGLDFV